jgi:putative ABC transport system ATP-binding protein
MIEFSHVTKVFTRGAHHVRALDDVSLTVPQGEFLSVMGRSGTGKSTLLHLVAGLDSPTSGEVTVAGQRLSKLSDKALTLFRRRNMGFVFQFFNLLPTLSVTENVALPLLLAGRRSREIKERTDSLIAMVGLEGRAAHRPAELSGGEMQRVAIARALATDPPVLLADEPTGNLDSRTGADILALLKSTARATGHTLVMVTHDAGAAAYGDRIIRLHDGCIAPGEDAFSFQVGVR